MAHHSGVHRLLVVSAITDETIDDMVDLGQQSWHLRRVVLMAFRHRGGDNLTLVIYPEMQFFPALVLLLAVLLSMPFALTTHL